MKFSIHGKRSMRHKPITIIFGTKTRVISCICVAAWKILTSRPTITVANNIGPIKMIAVFKNSLKIWTIRSWLICYTSQKKPLIMEPTSRFHPSTRTNNINLKGSDMNIGGSIIIPAERSMLATTISITRNGM